MPVVRVAAAFALVFSIGSLLLFLFADRDFGTATPESLGAGHGPPPIISEPGGRDPETGVEWQKFTVQGVTVLIPQDGGKNWLSNLNYDGCDPLRAQYFVVEYAPSGVRFRVDLQDREIRFNGAPSPVVQQVADAILTSFDGAFESDPRLRGTPRPIPVDCELSQPQDDIPPVTRAFEPPLVDEDPSAEPEPSSTRAPMPTPVFISSPVAID